MSIVDHAFILWICNHFRLPFTLIFRIIDHWGFPFTATWGTFTFGVWNQWSFEFTYNLYIIIVYIHCNIPSISSSQSSGRTASGSGII